MHRKITPLKIDNAALVEISLTIFYSMRGICNALEFNFKIEVIMTKVVINLHKFHYYDALRRR